MKKPRVSIRFAISAFALSVVIIFLLSSVSRLAPPAPAETRATAALVPNGSSRQIATYLGGSGSDLGKAIDASGPLVTIFGTTEGTDFPLRAPLQGRGSAGDAFMTRLRFGLNILFSTYVGGSGNETARGGVIDGAGAGTMVGTTRSTNFPVVHAAQPSYGSTNGSDDGFVTRIALLPRGTPGPHDAVVHVADISTVHGNWQRVADPSAAGGARLHNPDAGAAKVTTPLVSPADYFEFEVSGLSGGPYMVWARGKADNNSYNNDSVYLQFSNAFNTASDADNERRIFQIGTAEALAIVIEDCTGCGVHGWGWQDSGYGRKLPGTPVYFNDDRPTTVRVQRREDGISIDQIVIAKSDSSEGPYFYSAPGYQKDDDTILPAQQPSGNNQGDIIVYPGIDAGVHGAWISEDDPFAAGGRRVRHPNAGAPKLTAPLASPANYFEATFVAFPGVAYRLWIRGKADADYWGNDSVFVQFSDSVDPSGAPIWRIGTPSATTYVLEDCTGCGVQGWGWNDNGYGTFGPLVHFGSGASVIIRVQTREDGLAIDQIVLSPERYLNTAPGPPKNDATIVPR